jgi:hypothetical protein
MTHLQDQRSLISDAAFNSWARFTSSKEGQQRKQQERPLEGPQPLVTLLGNQSSTPTGLFTAFGIDPFCSFFGVDMLYMLQLVIRKSQEQPIEQAEESSIGHCNQRILA